MGWTRRGIPEEQKGRLGEIWIAAVAIAIAVVDSDCDSLANAAISPAFSPVTPSMHVYCTST